MPGLLTLHTDLKSLKYGHDTPGGGDSKQPYIKTDINTVDSGFNKLRLTKFDDGLIRGGAIGALNSSVVDTLRIGKFLTDFPKGPLFIVKQVGLQLSNPRLETRAIPQVGGGGLFGSVLNAGISFLNNNGIGPTRIYNLGINTIAQVPVNAFGGHINRHGFSPIPNENSYYINVVRDNDKNTKTTSAQSANNVISTISSVLGFNLPSSFQNIFKKDLVTSDNRLIQLTTKFGLSPRIQGTNTFSTNNNPNVIADYIGGPGSVYGIGKTLINRHGNATPTQDWTANDYAVNKAKNENAATNILAITDLNTNLSRDTVTNGPSSFPNTPDPQLPSTVYSNVKTYADILKINNSSNQSTMDIAAEVANLFTLAQGLNPISSTITPSNQFKQIASDPTTGKPTLTDGVIAYSSTPIQGGKIVYQNTYFEKVTVNKSNWKDAARNVRVGSGRTDSINLTPLFTAGTGQDSLVINIGGENYTINDLVKFRIEAINTDNPEQSTFMVFRAYITNFDDSTTANWDANKYIGRGEEFYIYNGFSRKINIGFKVAALSAKEMKPMYQKLNYLMSNLMPDYKGVLMRGPMTKMTVGNWIDSQPGVINSLTYTISNDSPWEIALNEPIVAGGTLEMVLPHIIDVSLSFTPIGVHTQGSYQTPKKSSEQSNIAQNWNGSKEKSNYIGSNIKAGSTAVNETPSTPTDPNFVGPMQPTEPPAKVSAQPSKPY
jgi:hypothetical protein